MSVCLLFMNNMLLYLQTKLLITLFFFVKVITMSVSSKNLAFPRTLVILFTKILVFKKKKFGQITGHSCHQ